MDCKDVAFRVMPDELGPTPEGVDPYDRSNRWMLLRPGKGIVHYPVERQSRGWPGGTEHMVTLVNKLTRGGPRLLMPHHWDEHIPWPSHGLCTRQSNQFMIRDKGTGSFTTNTDLARFTALKATPTLLPGQAEKINWVAYQI